MKVPVVALLLCFAVAYGAVVDLTPENFDTIVDGSKHVFVEFFAPWYVIFSLKMLIRPLACDFLSTSTESNI